MASPLQRAQQDGTPLIEGQAATFVFQGAEPPVLRGDFNGWDPEQAPEWQPDENDVWTIQLSLAEDAYIEYTFGTDEARVVDSFNPRRVSNGMGKYNNYFYMPRRADTVRSLPAQCAARHSHPLRRADAHAGGWPAAES